MVTVDELTRQSATAPAVLRYLARPPTAGAASPVVKRVVVFNDEAPPASLRGALVIVSTPGAERGKDALQRYGAAQFMASLARAEAAGLVVISDGSPAQQGEFLDAPLRIPVLAPTTSGSGDAVACMVLNRKVEATELRTSRLFKVVDLATALFRRGEGPEELLKLLRQMLDAEVTLIDPGGQRAPAGIPVQPELLARVQSETMHSASYLAQGRHVLLHPLSAGDPYTGELLVLAAARRTPWMPEHNELVRKAAGQIDLIHQGWQLRTRQRQISEAQSVIRENALINLSQGHVISAGIVLRRLLPDVLTREWGQVGVLRCAPDEDRAAVREAAERAMQGSALVEECPAEPLDVLILQGLERHDEGSGGPPELAQRLRHLIAGHPGRLLGVSPPRVWTETSLAYTSAVQALSAAVATPDRIYVHDGGAPLAMRLPQWAGAWGAALLAKTGELPEAERRQLLTSCGYTLSLGQRQAARLIPQTASGDAAEGEESGEGRAGLHRSTLSDRIAQLLRLTGLRATHADRAVLHLALQLGEVEPERDSGRAVPTLREVLNCEEAQRWAKELLHPLEELEGDDPFTLLETYLRHEAVQESTADALNVSRRTFRRRLGHIEATLTRHLIGPPWTGLHEALLALVITGRLPAGMLPDPISSAESQGQVSHLPRSAQLSSDKEVIWVARPAG